MGGYVDVSVPGYVKRLLAKLGHKPVTQPQYSPYTYQRQHAKPGSVQFDEQPDQSPRLDNTQQRHIQTTVGSFLWYSRAVENTTLPVVNEIARQQ